MEERTILHIDLNCFYASVEMMLDPDLQGKPVAVCGSTEDRHGIILAKSYPAKYMGVKTGMVNWEAKQLCPDLILVPPQYDQYMKFSKLTRAIYERFTDYVEPYGMDECWLDITDSAYYGKDGMKTAKIIKQTVKDELGLTVSVGVSFNKIFAKLGSDMKKPDAITAIGRDDFKNRVWPLPASDLLYVGRSTTRKLAYYGINTIGDIALSDPSLLKRILGINGIALWRFASGMDRSRVMPKGTVIPIKSVGHGITCNADLNDEAEVWKVMLELSQDIGHRLRINGLEAMGVQIAIRSNDLGGRQYQEKFSTATMSPMIIARRSFELFKSNYEWERPVRAVSLRGIYLVPKGTPRQTDMFTKEELIDRQNRIDDAVEQIREKFGKKAIYSASLMGDIKMPNDGRDIVRMPGQMYS